MIRISNLKEAAIKKITPALRIDVNLTVFYLKFNHKFARNCIQNAPKCMSFKVENKT